MSGDTVRRSAPKVGRNDPCHCGSGRKYKKCCATADKKRASEPSPADGLAMAAAREQPPRHPTAQDMWNLRPAQLEAMPVGELGREQLIVALKSLCGHGRWQAAERVLDEMADREAFEHDIDEFRDDVICEATREGQPELAARQLAKLSDPEVAQSADMRVLRVLLEPSEASLGTLEEVAREGLSEDPASLYAIAYGLLDTFPALGTLVARGSLDSQRMLDSIGLMDGVRDARFQLNLDPSDEYFEVLDWMEDRDAEGRLAAFFEAVRDERQAALLEKVESLDAESRDQRAMLDVLQRRLRAEEEALARVERAPGSDAEEARRLRRKIAELERLVAETIAQLTELREPLAKAESELVLALHSEPAGPERVEGDGTASEEDVEDVDAPGVPLVPQFEPAARDTLSDLPPHVARDAVRVAGALGAGDPSAWSQVKRLSRVPRAWSVRLGLYHRMLFDYDDGSLSVLAVVHRKDLLVAVDGLLHAARPASPGV